MKVLKNARQRATEKRSARREFERKPKVTFHFPCPGIGISVLATYDRKNRVLHLDENDDEPSNRKELSVVTDFIERALGTEPINPFCGAVPCDTLEDANAMLVRGGLDYAPRWR